jgi:putative ABC transport system permease protein
VTAWLRYLIGDAFKRLRRPLSPTIVSILIIFAGTTAVFATTGIAVAGQQRVLDDINSPTGRLITITDPDGSAQISPTSLRALRTISGVDWVYAVGPAMDVHNTSIPGSATVPARYAYGPAPEPVSVDAPDTLTTGRALAGPGLTQKLGLGDGVGAINSRTSAAVVVGTFTAEAPLQQLNKNVLIPQPATTGTGRLITIWISVTNVSQLTAVAAAATNALIAHNPGAAQISLASDLAHLNAQVTATLAQNARLTISGLLLAIAILVAALQYGRVAGITRDIGRRRALGASRGLILAQVLLDAGLTGLLAIILGTTAGLIINIIAAGAVPPFAFTLGVTVLIFLATILGALPPALRAASVDPVRVLRVP